MRLTARNAIFWRWGMIRPIPARATSDKRGSRCWCQTARSWPDEDPRQPAAFGRLEAQAVDIGLEAGKPAVELARVQQIIPDRLGGARQALALRVGPQLAIGTLHRDQFVDKAVDLGAQAAIVQQTPMEHCRGQVLAGEFAGPGHEIATRLAVAITCNPANRLAI